jgi:hypothetical protein
VQVKPNSTPPKKATWNFIFPTKSLNNISSVVFNIRLWQEAKNIWTFDRTFVFLQYNIE